MTVLFGVRHESDQLYGEELEQLTQRDPNFHALYTMSHPGPN